VSAADLDALDRGVIEAGQLAALEAQVADLARQAGLPLPPPKPPRPRHLKTVK
jgi:hypothetical protein